MNDWTSFGYHHSEQRFLERLCALMREEVILPTDGQVHQVRLIMNIQCEVAPKMDGNSSFLLGGGSAG